MADTLVHVPDGILNNILVRVPIKSLSRFRCVSKHWKRLISNPDFMKSISRRKIFLPGQSYCQTIEKVVSGESMGYRMVMAHSPIQVKRVIVAGTTNGLVLLVLNFYSPYTADNMNLYNPLTRVFKKVPNLHYISQNLAFGFGHGASQDDLKIVTVGVHNYVSSLLSWSVFSVKNQSWSTMAESIGDYKFTSYAGTFLNGFLYWGIVRENHLRMSIVALDMKEMILFEIQVPYDGVYFPTLGTINGCLCLLYYNGFFDGYRLLVMKDHGIWESRLKECSTSKLLSRMDYHTFRVMCILDEGKVIMKNITANTFLIIDLLKDSCEHILVCTDFNQALTTQAIEYVESCCNI